jgi:hypothetical protein
MPNDHYEKPRRRFLHELALAAVLVLLLVISSI